MTFLQDRFQRNLVLSLSAHVAILLFFTVKAVVFPSEPLVFQESLRVDIIALPQKVQQRPRSQKTVTPPKAPNPQQKVKAPVKPKAPPKKVVINKKNAKKQKSDQLAALRQLEARSALDKLKNLAEPTPAPVQNPVAETETTTEPAQQKIEYKGNVISAGSSLTGVQRLQQDRYLGVVKRHIVQNWFLPEWFAESKLSAQVLVKIDKNGSLLSYEIRRSSGDDEFDKLVLSTVQKSHPLPKPPEKFVQIVAVNGLVLGFPE